MKKIFKNPLMLLALGILVIGASTVGATRAAMISQNEANRVNFTTATFSVDLLGDIADNQIVFPEIDEDDYIKIGKFYNENISVVNNSGGNYDEYVRVVVRKSWKNEKPEGFGKDVTLSPEMIELRVAPGWYINKDESTPEQDVYYRLSPIAQNEEVQFITGIRVNEKVIKEVEHGGMTTEIINEYRYNGSCMDISLQADAVQTNSSRDAIQAAWGIGTSFTTVDDAENESQVSFVIMDGE